jgi:hypothetical protein
MSDQPLSRRALTTLASYRTSLLSAISHLKGLEEAFATSRVRPSGTRTTDPSRVSDTQVCEGCHGLGHHFTECLNHSYVWDSEANARLLAPGERLSGPATWHDIHRASLHHLIRTTLKYYLKLHPDRLPDIRLLLSEFETPSDSGDIPPPTNLDTSLANSKSSPVIDSLEFDTTATAAVLATDLRPPVATTPSVVEPGIFLINLAILAATTRLRVDPWNQTSGYIQLIACHYWHPSFGLDFSAFLLLVEVELEEGRLHNQDLQDTNPFHIQSGSPSG